MISAQASPGLENTHLAADRRNRVLAWVLGTFSLALLGTSAVMLAVASDPSNSNWLESQVKSIVTLGAAVLGMVILARQPRQRVGWLWIAYSLTIGFRTMGHGIYFSHGAQSSGYSQLELFFIWSTEAAGFLSFLFFILLMLWFPNGELVTRRWRFLYIWLAAAMGIVFTSIFQKGPNWNGGEDAGGIVINNPYGILPAEMPPGYTVFFLTGFLSILVIMFLSAASLIVRYRKSGPTVRLQLRWFIFGSAGLILLQMSFFLGILFSEVITHAAIVPVYLAVGVAILRYRLYDIDLIIRRTLQYGLLSGLLVLGYFGGVVILQSIFGSLTGDRSSPLITVISTLVIAGLFSPLRIRTQNLIDRRFYRAKYNAEQALAGFARAARDEVDLDWFTGELINVVDLTVKPEKASIWLKAEESRHARKG